VTTMNRAAICPQESRLAPIVLQYVHRGLGWLLLCCSMFTGVSAGSYFAAVCPHESRLAPAQPLTELVLGIKRPVREAGHLPSSSVTVKKS
jgi:hypothetical protein